MSIGMLFCFSQIRRRPLITWGVFEDFFDFPPPLVTCRLDPLAPPYSHVRFFKTCTLGIEAENLLKKHNLINY